MMLIMKSNDKKKKEEKCARNFLNQKKFNENVKVFKIFLFFNMQTWLYFNIDAAEEGLNIVSFISSKDTTKTSKLRLNFLSVL